jgi:hypothetical protein
MLYGFDDLDDCVHRIPDERILLEVFESQSESGPSDNNQGKEQCA